MINFLRRGQKGFSIQENVLFAVVFTQAGSAEIPVVSEEQASWNLAFWSIFLLDCPWLMPAPFLVSSLRHKAWMCADWCEGDVRRRTSHRSLEASRHCSNVHQGFYYFHIWLQLKCQWPPARRGPICREPWQAFPKHSTRILYPLTGHILHPCIAVQRGSYACLLQK